MAQKFDIGLNAKINDFAKKFNIIRTDDNDDDVFEDFSNYVIASNILEEELDNVKLVSTNKAQGIDGIVIVVNNKLVSEEADLGKFGPTEAIQIKIGFIQSTTQSSFDEKKFSAFTDEVVKNYLMIQETSLIEFRKHHIFVYFLFLQEHHMSLQMKK